MTSPVSQKAKKELAPLAPDRALLENLPKASVQHLYRTFVAPARNESKDDLVDYLWRAYNHGKRAESFWHWVAAEQDYVERCKAAKAAGLPKPLT